MKFRPLAISVGIAGLLALAACSGPGGTKGDSALRAPASSRAAPSASSRPELPADAKPEARASASASAAPEEQKDTSAEQISTFALDVDTASYTYARRTLQEGRWPEPGQIRPEEFVNAFRQDYAQPRDDGFTVHVDGAMMPSRNQAVLRVGLQTRASDAAARRPANLTFVIDVSGSMAEPGRLDLVKQSLHTLIDQLAPGDQVSIVSFSDEATVLASMTPLAARTELHAAVDQLTVAGSTNLEAGLEIGRASCRERV